MEKEKALATAVAKQHDGTSGKEDKKICPRCGHEVCPNCPHKTPSEEEADKK